MRVDLAHEQKYLLLQWNLLVSWRSSSLMMSWHACSQKPIKAKLETKWAGGSKVFVLRCMNFALY